MGPREVLEQYYHRLRATGRTYDMISKLRDGDIVIFTNKREAERVEKICKDMGLKIHPWVVDPKSPHMINHTKAMGNNVILDHTWVEDYYLHAIDTATKELKYFSKETKTDQKQKIRNLNALVQRWI